MAADCLCICEGLMSVCTKSTWADQKGCPFAEQRGNACAHYRIEYGGHCDSMGAQERAYDKCRKSSQRQLERS